MKSVSQSTAKILFLVSLVIAAGSVTLGIKLSKQLSSTEMASRIAQQDDAQASRAFADLSTLLKGHEPAQSLDRALEQTVYTLQHEKVGARITLASIVPTTTTKGGPGVKVMPSTVGNTNLQAVTLLARGTYADYEGLMDYLAAVKSLPVAITRLKIDGSSFELSVMVLGN